MKDHDNEPLTYCACCRPRDSELDGAGGYCAKCREFHFGLNYRSTAGPDRLETETALDMRGEMNWKDELDIAGGAVVGFSAACGYIRDPMVADQLRCEPETLELLFKEFREMALWMADLYTEVQGLEDAA